MGVLGRKRKGVAAVAGLVAVAAVVVVTRDGDESAPSGEFAFPEGELLVPGDEVREYELTNTRPALPRYFDVGTGPHVVTTFEGQIATVTPVSADAVRELDGGLAPDPELAEVAGRPTVHYGWHLAPLPDQADFYLTWLATDDLLVHVASRTLDRAALTRLAEAVEVQSDGELRVPGEVIGEIPPVYYAPQPGVAATFERRTPNGYRRVDVSIIEADRSVQDAYLALAAPDGFITATPHYSCCMGTMPPRRTIDVDGREVTAVALTADYHLVVLHGDRGAVVIVNAGRSRTVPRDVWLADLASSLTPVAPDDFTPVGTQPE